MNLFKKFLTGAFVGAMTLAVAAGTGMAAADAESVTKDDVSVNGSTLEVSAVTTELIVGGTKENKADEVLVAFPTVKEKSGEYTVTIKEWDTYETKESGVAYVDLSNLKPEKDNYVAIKTTDKTEVALFKIPAGANGIKGAYTVAASGSSVSLTVKDGKTTSDFKGDVEYRTAMGNWEAYNAAAVDLQAYAQQGATLYFRQAVSGTGDCKKQTVKYSAKSVSAAAFYVVDTNLPSKEVKVKITKLASAPKVTADYAKKQVKFPKNCEYRIGTSGAWTDVPSTNVIELTADQLTAAGVVEARTKADAAKKKAASKIGRLEFPADTPVSVEVDPDAATKSAVTATIEGGVVKVGAVDTKKKVEITNSSANVFELYAGDAAPDAAAKATKLAAAKNGKNGSVKLTAEAGKKLYIRRAADSKLGIWVSEWVEVGVIE